MMKEELERPVPKGERVAHMGSRQRHRLLLGLALLSGAALMLEVSVARVQAAVLGPEIGYPLWAIALVSCGLGVLVSAVVPALVRPEGLLRRLGHLSAAISATSVASVIYLVYLSGSRPGGRFYLALAGPSDLAGTLVWASVLALGSLPFALIGVAMRSPGRSAPRPATRRGSAWRTRSGARSAASPPSPRCVAAGRGRS
jgi:hypothetical protein